MEIELSNFKNFVYLKGYVKSKRQCGGVTVNVKYANGEIETHKVPVSLKGSIKYLLSLKNRAEKLEVLDCEVSDELVLEVERLNPLKLVYKLYGFLLSLYFKRDVLKKAIRDNLKRNLIEAILNPYKVYREAQYLMFFRNSGMLSKSDYFEYIRNHTDRLKRKQISVSSFASVILNWSNQDIDETINSLNKANFSEILVYKENVDIQELLNRSVSDYFLFLYPKDMVIDFSLEFLNIFVVKKGLPAVFYCDHIESDGTIYFKPDWSFYYYIHYDYIANAVFFRRDILEHIGKLRKDLGGYALYEVLLKLYRIHGIIPEHLPVPILIKGHTEKDWDTGLTILESLIDNGDIQKNNKQNTFIYIPHLREKPEVLIIIPTKDKSKLLKKCIYSILEKTTYEKYRILIVDNASMEEETFELYSELRRFDFIDIVEYNKPYNFSKIVNYAIKTRKEEFIVLLNNDTEVLSEDWLEWMVRYLSLKDVGIVGAKLLYPDLRVQHAGVVVGLSGCADHAFRGCEDDWGYMDRLGLPQEYLAVTAACMGFKRSVHEEVGGFDEELAVNFNDLDFCLKVYTKGYKIIYLPQVKLIHHEHATRGKDDSPEKMKLARKEKGIILKRWKRYVEHDPYYNPNLTLYRRDFSPAMPRFHWLE